MISRLNLVMILLSGIMLGYPLHGSSEAGIKIIGRLVKADAANGIIYVMHDSRIIRFRASKEICMRFSPDSKPLVEISYSKCGEKGFCVDTIEIIPDEKNKEDLSDLKGSGAVK